MSVLFSVAGGLVEAQDEAVAAALGRAAEEPAGLRSVGLMAALAMAGSPAGSALAFAANATGAVESPEVGGYGRVGPEDVSATSLERIVAAAQALDPGQFAQVQLQVSSAGQVLDSAATMLRRELGDVLGGAWQGEFAQKGTVMVEALTDSAFELVGVLDEVATRAEGAHAGFETTRSRVSSDSELLTLSHSATPGLGSGPGAALGPPTPAAAAAAAAARAAAEDQARAVVNTEYSPAVMKANLDDLQFPTAFPVVSGTALGDARGIDPVTAWNIGGTAQTAGAAAPGAAALAHASGSGAGGAGGAGSSPSTMATPLAGTDATTEQALLASRTGAGDTTGLVATSGAGAPTGAATAGPAAAPLNAATTPAGTPPAPAAVNPAHQAAGAGAGGHRGLRGSTTTGGRDRDRGFAGAAGLLGGGGAAGAGAGALRMGGAGTLAGLGGAGTAGPGGAPVAGAPGAGAGATGGTPPAASSSASTGAGRPGAIPMGMMGAGAQGQGTDRRGHTPASYLTNATNTTEIIGNPVKVAPAVLGRTPAATGETTTETTGRTVESAPAGSPKSPAARAAGGGIVGLRAMAVPKR